MLSPDFTPFPELSTERLVLRELTLNDAPQVQELRSNPDVMKYISRPLTTTLELARAWISVVIDALKNSNGITWCMCLKENPAEHVGNVGLWRWEKENHRAEIGYMINPSLQGNGLMCEAVREVLRYGFTELNLHSIEGRIDPRNEASARVLERTGFKKEGYLRESYNLRGEFVDTAIYSVLNPNRSTGSADLKSAVK